MKVPENLLYTKTHEWLRQENDGSVTVGITDYAQHELGDVVYIELPEKNSKVEKQKPFGTIESAKSVSELIAPLSGDVVDVNEEVKKKPELVNKDPYEFWFIKIKPSNREDIKELLSCQAYREHTGEDS